MSEITAASARKLTALCRSLLSLTPEEALAFTLSLRARRARPQAPLKVSTRRKKSDAPLKNETSSEVTDAQVRVLAPDDRCN